MRAWFRVTLAAPLPAGMGKPRLRMVTFNAAPATNATTVTSEILGTSDGGRAALARDDVLAGCP